ncbi:hypothetical protein IGI04_041335, partial [Brassica rapa subsp. trilocularis]
AKRNSNQKRCYRRLREKSRAFKREKPDQRLGSGVRPARERLCRRRSLSSSFLFVSFCFFCTVPPRSLCLSSGSATNRHRWSDLNVQVLALGERGYPRSVVVNFFSGSGGLLRSTVAGSSFQEGETHLTPPSPAFGHGERRLAKLHAVVFGSLSLFWVFFSFLFGFWVVLVVVLAFAVVRRRQVKKEEFGFEIAMVAMEFSFWCDPAKLQS